MKDLTTTSQSLMSSSELWPVGVKLGIVRLGRAAGKLKYTLLDEQDIVLAREYSFEARLEIDRDGNGAIIFAYAFTNGRRRSSARYLQDVIWESHFGNIPPALRVVHKNHIPMDNRLDNLCLVTHSEVYNWYSTSWRTLKTSDQHLTLYWAAIQQLPPEHLHNEHSPIESTKYFDANGDLIDDEDQTFSYYECHYAPCIRIEREPREFSICGRCQQTRYCGLLCQQRDWPIHKRYCRERHREAISKDRPPER